MFDFEKFPVYLEAELFYADILKIFRHKQLPKDIKDQLRRASLSIVLNIAEGSGKFSLNDKKNFYVISRGSVNECVSLLRILKIEEIINLTEYHTLYNRLDRIAKMLSGLIKFLLKK